MGFLDKLFGKKDKLSADKDLALREMPIQSNGDFWNWFQQYEQQFFNAVQNQANIEEDFFNLLDPKLQELKDGFYFLTGMYNNDTAELILTADGDVKNIVFVEELIADAPSLKGWKFTALKPESDLSSGIEMDGYKFDKDNVSFAPVVNSDYPDDVVITITHSDFTDENNDLMNMGVNIYLDNYLGELNYVTKIDLLTVDNKDNIKDEIVPIGKLKEYLNWRQKEFIEKYEGLRHETESDTYSSFQGKLKNGKPYLSIVNTSLLNWDSKASHPWILSIEIKYDGENNNGMPTESVYKILDEIENKTMLDLKDKDGYLNVARETGNNVRTIYFACKEFRKSSKVACAIQNKYKNQFDMDYSLYKDKYWITFNRYQAN